MKLIIDIPDEQYEHLSKIADAGEEPLGYYERVIMRGIPLEDNSERAEVQAYFVGEDYGWEEGRKSLIDDAKVEIENYDNFILCVNGQKGIHIDAALAILDKYKVKSEDEE